MSAAVPDVNIESIHEVTRHINEPVIFPKINTNGDINVILIASISTVGTLSALLAIIIIILGLAYYFKHKR